MGAINKKPRPETWLTLENIDFRNRWINPGWAERHAVDIIKRGYPGKHQNGFQPGLETRQNIRAQVIADDNRLL